MARKSPTRLSVVYDDTIMRVKRSDLKRASGFSCTVCNEGIESALLCEQSENKIQFVCKVQHQHGILNLSQVFTLTFELECGKNIPRLKTPIKGPPVIPKRLKANCKITTPS